jgi:hypothetical protein
LTVEHLPNMHQTLRSIPSIAKKKPCYNWLSCGPRSSVRNPFSCISLRWFVIFQSSNVTSLRKLTIASLGSVPASLKVGTNSNPSAIMNITVIAVGHTYEVVVLCLALC